MHETYEMQNWMCMYGSQQLAGTRIIFLAEMRIDVILLLYTRQLLWDLYMVVEKNGKQILCWGVFKFCHKVYDYKLILSCVKDLY